MITGTTGRFVALSLLAAAAVGAAVPPAAQLDARGVKTGLNRAARAAGKLYFGTATNSDQWNDTTYFGILKDGAEFGQITPANVMKWVRCASRCPSTRRAGFSPRSPLLPSCR